MDRYPSVAVSREGIAEAGAGIQLARTSYLPKAAFHAQLNRATRNNIYGMLFPQQVISPISGPPNPNNSFTNVWGSAAGFLVAWEPFDFGLRRAGMDAAGAARRRAESSLARTQYDVATSAADAYLTILATQQTTRTAAAAVERARVFHEAVSALVKAELRPGVEAERAQAELAMAESQRIQAEQSVNVAKAALAQLLGVAPAVIDLQPGPLLGDPSGLATPASPSEAHPLLAEQTAAVEESKAQQKVLDKSYFPTFNVHGTTYARGSGANPDFTTGGAAAGLGPNIHNWGLGFSLTFNIMDYAALRARKQAEASRTRAEQARLQLMRQELTGQLEKAKAMLDGAQRIAANLPIQLKAARAAEVQAGARYRAGLGTLIDVAEAQRLLTQTEIDDSLAKLQIWRSMFAVAIAQGELQALVAQTSIRPPGK
jgi:outer membrane protein TolC